MNGQSEAGTHALVRHDEMCRAAEYSFVEGETEFLDNGQGVRLKPPKTRKKKGK